MESTDSIVKWIGSSTWKAIPREGRWVFGLYDSIDEQPEKDFFYVSFSYLKEKNIHIVAYMSNVMFLSFLEKNKEKYKDCSDVELLLLHTKFLKGLNDYSSSWKITDADFSLDQDFLDFINKQVNS